MTAPSGGIGGLPIVPAQPGNCACEECSGAVGPTLVDLDPPATPLGDVGDLPDPDSVPPGTVYVIGDTYYISGPGGYSTIFGGGSMTFLYYWKDLWVPTLTGVNPGDDDLLDAQRLGPGPGAGISTVDPGAGAQGDPHCPVFANPFQLNSMDLHWWAYGPHVVFTEVDGGATARELYINNTFSVTIFDQLFNLITYEDDINNCYQNLDINPGGLYHLPRAKASGRVKIPPSSAFSFTTSGGLSSSPNDVNLAGAVYFQPANIIARGILTS